MRRNRPQIGASSSTSADDRCCSTCPVGPTKCGRRSGASDEQSKHAGVEPWDDGSADCVAAVCSGQMARPGSLTCSCMASQTPAAFTMLLRTAMYVLRSFLGTGSFRVAVISRAAPGANKLTDPTKVPTHNSTHFAQWAEVVFLVLLPWGSVLWAKARQSSASYFTVTTFTTTGFGDNSARSPHARLLVTAQMILGAAILPNISCTLPSELNEEITQLRADRVQWESEGPNKS